MNAAFLLVTSAWLAGGQTPPPVAQPAPHPVHIAPAPSASCGGNCGSPCGDPCGKPSLLDRIRAKFQRNECDSCAPACAPAPVCKPAPAPTCAPACDPCDKPGLFDRIRARSRDTGCGGGCGSPCGDPCDKPGLFDRIRAKFQRNDCGAPACNTGCANGGCAAPGTIHAIPAKPAEQIGKPPQEGAPMKLPDGGAPKEKETIAPKNLELTPTGGTPKITETGTKNPF